MSEAVLRPGVVADAEALRRLGEAVVPATYAPIDTAYAEMMLREWWSTEGLAAMLERLPHRVAEVDGAVVGVANLGRRDDRAVMWKLYVHPDHHGAGIGGRLLDAVLELVGDEPLWLEHVDGNEAARAFYDRRGFVEVERVPQTPYPDDVWMRREP